ncbi:MAG: HNH endonuclease [bacterium]|nr:HNH endonuclease [bacterium]MCY4256916.1 HNH endonuclease [bacterium]
MSRALVLNASYEPLSVVAQRRALVLVLAEKAEVILESDDRFRSERLDLAVPSVVRLLYYVKVPFFRTGGLSRRGVFARDEYRCQYCGCYADSIDHVQPKSRGGTHSWENVVAACRRCNIAKRDRLLSETHMRLLRPPAEPPRSAWVASAVGHVPQDWLPYLGSSSEVA